MWCPVCPAHQMHAQTDILSWSGSPIQLASEVTHSHPAEHFPDRHKPHEPQEPHRPEVPNPWVWSCVATQTPRRTAHGKHGNHDWSPSFKSRLRGPQSATLTTLSVRCPAVPIRHCRPPLFTTLGHPAVYSSLPFPPSFSPSFPPSLPNPISGPAHLS